MSNYSYPPPARPPERQPRPGNPAPARNRRSGRKKKKAKFWTLSAWQVAILLGLGICIAICAVSCWLAEKRMDILLADRDSARRAYEATVANHRSQLNSLSGMREIIEKYANVNGVDPAFVAAVIKRESDFRPDVKSDKKAVGLMQILLSNREWLAGKINRPSITDKDMYDPETNVQMGCWYLGYLSRMFDGDPILVASAYHAGQNNVKYWLSKFSSDGVHLTIEQVLATDGSQNYVRKVLESYAIYQQNIFTD